MKYKRRFLVTALTVGLMALVGCNDDDTNSNLNDKNSGGNDGQPTLSYSNFYLDYNENGEKNLVRSEIKFYNSGISTSYETLFGSLNTLGETVTDTILLANDFEYTFEDYVDSHKLYANLSDIIKKVDEDAVYQSYKASNGNSIDIKEPYVNVDIAGYDLSVYDRETGVYAPEFNDFEYEGNSSPALKADLEAIKFPEGSICTTFLKSDIYTPYYIFSKEELDTFGEADQIVPNVAEFANSLEEIIAFERTSNPNAADAQIDNVGVGNKYRAIHFLDRYDDYMYAYVEYDGEIYYASYSANENEVVERGNNTDPSSGIVYCDGYNDIAADFIEDKLLTYYDKS